MEGLNRLDVYRSAQNLAQYIYSNVLSKLPAEEKWGLNSQIRRSASSIPANIAEGYCRYYYQETIRFCYLARGYLMELSSHIDLAYSQNYLTDVTKSQIDEMMTGLLRLINGYIKYLKQSKRGWNEPGAQQIAENNNPYYSEEDEQITGPGADL